MLLITVTSLVLAVGGGAAGADPPSWAHGHGHGPQGGGLADQGGGPPGHGGGGPPRAHRNGPPPPPPAPETQSPPSGQSGPSQGDNPGHGGTPPGHSPHGRGHEGGHSTPTAAPASSTAPTRATYIPAVTTPAVTPPSVPAPVTTPVLPTTGTPAAVTGSPRPLLNIITTLRSLSAARRGAGRGGAATPSLGTAGTAPGGGLLGNPLTTALAPATGRVGAAGASGSRGVLHHPGQGVKVVVVPPGNNPATVIAHFISRIPAAVWIALAAALGFAAMAGGAAVVMGRRASRRADEVAAVTAAASTDQLTGILNRRGFTEAAGRELERARRYGRPLALAYVDVRGLKAVNDSEGHLAGDRLLKEVAVLLTQSARTHDLVGRMGGDELAVVLAEQTAPGAEAMARRVQNEVPAHRAALGLSTDWDVTIGTASFPEDGDRLDDLFAAADRRLYEQRGIALSNR